MMTCHRTLEVVQVNIIFWQENNPSISGDYEIYHENCQGNSNKPSQQFKAFHVAESKLHFYIAKEN